MVELVERKSSNPSKSVSHKYQPDPIIDQSPIAIAPGPATASASAIFPQVIRAILPAVAAHAEFHSGIVREFTAAIAHAGANVEELTTGLESAPMSGHPMFRAHGIVSIAEDTETEILITAIETLGGDLTVDLSI